METKKSSVNQIKLNLPESNNYYVEEAFKFLRTNIQFCGSDIKVIAFTSCNENEGKSVISLHVAKSLSELGKKVLFMDADMRKSVLARRNTNLKAAPAGLSELLSGMVPVNDVMLDTQYPNLQVILSGKYPPNPVELLGSSRFSQVMDVMRKYYDYVIVDTPPLGTVIDAAVVAAKCDGTILVISDGKVRARQAQGVIEQLEKSHCKILGAVRNKIPKRGKSYYKKGYAYK